MLFRSKCTRIITDRWFFTQKVLRTEVLRTEGFTHNIFHIPTFLHTDVFTQTQIAHRNLCTQHAFTHNQLLPVSILLFKCSSTTCPNICACLYHAALSPKEPPTSTWQTSILSRVVLILILPGFSCNHNVSVPQGGASVTRDSFFPATHAQDNAVSHQLW